MDTSNDDIQVVDLVTDDIPPVQSSTPTVTPSVINLDESSPDIHIDSSPPISSSASKLAPLRVSLFNDDSDSDQPQLVTSVTRPPDSDDEESDEEIMAILRNPQQPPAKRPRLTPSSSIQPSHPKITPTAASHICSNSDANTDTDDHFEDIPIDVDNQEPNPFTIHEVRHLFELNKLSSDATSEMETPTEMNVLLLRHQRQALQWMVYRESPDQRPGIPRGGILADDQGFGKTMSMIALMLTKRREGGGRWRNLIVAPNSILHQWATEFESRIDAVYRPRVLLYHGIYRPRDPRVLASYDVVITSYGTMKQDYKQVMNMTPVRNDTNGTKRSFGPLFRVHWFRVVLDEAQAIKNFRGEAFHAAAELKTERRWALTGTPIQNSLDDIYAQFLFLGYSVTPSYRDWVRRYKRPLEGNMSMTRKKKLFQRFQAILGVVLLRRAKHDRIDGELVMKLPAKTITVKELEFSKTERMYYQATEVRSVQYLNSRSANATESGGQVMAIFLVILMKLRMACGHPALCEWGHLEGFRFSDEELDVAELRMKTNVLLSVFSETVKERLKIEFGPENVSIPNCPICFEVIETDGVVTRCGHVFCKSDFEGWSTENSSCPTCRNHVAGESDAISLTELIKEIHALDRKHKRDLGLLSGDDDNEKEEKEKDVKKKKKKGKTENDEIILFPQEQKSTEEDVVEKSNAEHNGDEEDSKKAQTSTKIRAFMEDYKKIIDTTNDKVLCFSQWTRMLDLIEIPLRECGFEFVRLDGSMSLQERQAAVRTFNTRSKCRLFLISLSAGSTGLNLTVANRVYLMDSWWNPAVEKQAIDRVHRIGQTKDVEVVRMKIKNTVEDHILELQERKHELSDGALGVEGLKTMGRRRLTLQDVAGLFTDVAENVAARAEGEQNNMLAEMARNMMDLYRL